MANKFLTNVSLLGTKREKGRFEILATQRKKAAYSAALELRGKDLNLRPLGYEHNLMMAGPFVSKHFVPDNGRFYPLFSDFCDHFVSKN